MTTRFLFLPFLFILSLPLYAQHALSDAIRLRQYVRPVPGARTIGNFTNDEAASTKALEILWNYGPEDKQFIGDAFEGNPFIGSESEVSVILLPDLFMEAVTDENFRGSVKADKAPAPPAKGLSIGVVADGLARFLAQRMKEELSMAFFNRLKKAIEQDVTLGALFPGTKNQLWVIDKEIFHFERYIDVLRESFISDLRNLPHQSRQYLQQRDYSKQPGLKLVVEDVLELSQFLIDGRPLDDWFQFLAYEASIQDAERVALLPEEAQKRTQGMAASLRLTAVLSESLRNSGPRRGPGAVWVAPEEVRRALKDPITLYLYLGLLWQQESAADVVFPNGKTLRAALEPLADEAEALQGIRRAIELWAQTGREVSALLESYQNQAIVSDSLGDDVVSRFLNSFFNLTEIALEVQDLLFEDAFGSRDELQKLYENLRDLNSFNYNIRRKNYVYAIHNLSGVLVRLTGDSEVRKELLRYGNFMATVAEARTSEEVAHAIELFALPPGSSAMKKNSAFSVSLNAYSGISYGWEYLRNDSRNIEGSPMLAFSAPLGFDVNVGFGRAGSLSFYTPIIDVGAITAFRLRNDMAADFPELKLENILAPGAFLVYGGPANLPVAFGMGFQKGPNLRRINDPAMPEIVNAGGYRFAVFFSIDIPISHLYVN
ncbi:MAG: hypothetical protein KF852_16870 [Saprospiraceae bacterium]|nr:hypothetical protein [Saprospiraceae bacterium]